MANFVHWTFLAFIFVFYGLWIVHFAINWAISVEDPLWEAADSFVTQSSLAYFHVITYLHNVLGVVLFPRENLLNGQVISRRYPRRNCTIEELSEQQAEDLTGFTIDELNKLLLAYFSMCGLVPPDIEH
jgi:hypothetical protein